MPGADLGVQFNFEYRAADATASPYMQLGAVVRAGLQGLREALPMPTATTSDPEQMSMEQRSSLNIARLPLSLAEALDALEADEVAKAWFPPAMLDAYLRHKRSEIELMRELSPEEQCARYVSSY